MSSPSDRPCVLVADDEDIHRRLLKRVFEAASFDVVLAEDGVAALAAVERQAPSVAIIDLRMPGWDGLETLQRIKAVAPELPAILLTGDGDVPTAVEAIKLGADDFILKPIENERLVSVIECALQRHHNAPPTVWVGPDGTEVDWRVNAVLQYVELGHANSGCCLADIAQQLQVSKSHLSRLVVKETGVTFQAHLQLARMSAAEGLLQETNFTIKEISAKTGYVHVPSFDRSFRRSFGITPGQYRHLRNAPAADPGAAPTLDPPVAQSAL